MMSLRRATSPSNASAGGQEEQPCEVNNSTTLGRVCAAAGEMSGSDARPNSATTCAMRCKDMTLSHSGRSRRWECRAGLSDHISVRELVAGGTPAVRSAGLLKEACGKAGDLPRFFHVAQGTGIVEDVHRHSARERLAMRDRDDAVVAAPDDLHRHFQMEGDLGDPFALDAVRKPFPRERFQRRLHAVEPLVAQDVLDHLAADYRRIVHEE